VTETSSRSTIDGFAALICNEFALEAIRPPGGGARRRVNLRGSVSDCQGDDGDHVTTAAADELVVVRCQLGERAAFDELVQRWHHPLWSFVHRMVGNPARSDDLTQEIWLRVVRGLPRLAAPDRFPAWLFTLARRVVYDELRHRYRQLDTDPLSGAEETAPASETDDVGSLLDRLELESALAGLAPRDREVVALFHLADLPLDDVAQILAIPPGTVKSRLHRARQKLGIELRNEGTDR